MVWMKLTAPVEGIVFVWPVLFRFGDDLYRDKDLHRAIGERFLFAADPDKRIEVLW